MSPVGFGSQPSASGICGATSPPQNPPKYPFPANSRPQILLSSPNGGLGAAPRPVPGYLGQFIPQPPSENVLFSAETSRGGGVWGGGVYYFWASVQFLLPSPASGSPSLPGCSFWGAEPCWSPPARIWGFPSSPVLRFRGRNSFFPEVWDRVGTAMEAAAAGDGEGGGLCDVCAQTLLGPVSDFKGLGKVYLSSSFPYVLAPSCGGHHMCSSAALGIFPSAGEGGIFPVDASWPLLLSHFFPLSRAPPGDCSPFLPPSPSTQRGRSRAKPQKPPASFPKQAGAGWESSRRRAKLSFKQQSERRRGKEKNPSLFQENPAGLREGQR